VLPGPAFLVIPLGLAILATEFVWAEVLLKKAKGYFDKGKERVMGKKAEQPKSPSTSARSDPHRSTTP
jgi:hypothetical protein